MLEKLNKLAAHSYKLSIAQNISTFGRINWYILFTGKGDSFVKEMNGEELEPLVDELITLLDAQLKINAAKKAEVEARAEAYKVERRKELREKYFAVHGSYPTDDEVEAML